MDFILSIIHSRYQTSINRLTRHFILLSSLTITTMALTATSAEYNYQYIANIKMIISQPASDFCMYISNVEAELFFTQL